LTISFWFTAVAAKPSIAIEMPATPKSAPSRLRVVMKPDFEEDCFFMETIPDLVVTEK
jgi:hypothetical protein